MSSARFAPVTASLFVRRGDAVASAPPRFAAPVRDGGLSQAAGRPAPPKTPLPPLPPPRDNSRPHKVRVSLSDSEFEAFGLAAVKRGVTRQQLLREAINRHLDDFARDYGQACACLSRASCGCNA